jgi:hypothetical protein
MKPTPLLLALAALAWPLRAAEFVTCPPMRPLPQPSSRPLEGGPAFYADAARGDDRNDGSKEKPWKTIAASLGKLKPGDTLCLRGGVYYERVGIAASGEKGRPITVRACPGELAVLDGGFREFAEKPAECWEPAPGGASHEYVSKRAFPGLAKGTVTDQFVTDWDEPFTGIEDDRPVVLGSFADSMVPLHPYRFLRDLRAPEDGVWRIKDKQDKEGSVYCGPGFWYDRADGRIHVRLAPTQFAWFGPERNYRGETDPRKVPLVVAGGFPGPILGFNGARHVRVQDLVIRGGAGVASVNVQGGEGIELDGLTVFGGSPSLLGKSAKGFRVLNCAFRSLGSAPWENRASMKYRGIPDYLVISRPSGSLNADWEIANCEFTDGHDFAFFRNVRNLRFHHNFVDNFNDDGMEFGPRLKEQLAWVHENLLSRMEIVLSQHEIDKVAPEPGADPGSGIYVFRNVIDLRQPTYNDPPREGGPPKKASKGGDSIWRNGTLASDHGSPVWAQYYFYQNTALWKEATFRNYYASSLGVMGLAGNPRIVEKGDANRPALVKTARRVFNNIFVQAEGAPGLVLPPKPEEVDLQVDGNLFWGADQGDLPEADFFVKARSSPAFELSKKQYPPGWGANDRYGNPKFARFPGEKGGGCDLAIAKDGPAAEGGVPIPADWPDTLRAKDEGKPDIGALPAGAAAPRVGVNGRLSLFPVEP